MKKPLFILLIMFTILVLVACGGSETLSNLQDTPEPPPQNSNEIDSDADGGSEELTLAPLVSVGDIINFGEIDWLVLDVQSDRVLIISWYILDIRAYHGTNELITWEYSDIRHYLNNEFMYNRFTPDEILQIAETTLINSNNQWFGTDGGNDTIDRVFLLSIEEVVRYFGDSGKLGNQPQAHYWGISDEFNLNRIAYLHDSVDVSAVVTDLPITPGGSWSWWLRSPGGQTKFPGIAAVAYVLPATFMPDMSDMTEREIMAWETEANLGGTIDVEGTPVYMHIGVRPALWLYR